MKLINYNFNDIPAELKKMPNWILWKAEEKENGKITKIPYQIDGREAQSNNPHTWSTFHTAVNFYNDSNVDGIGFVFSRRDNFVGIDIDHCITYEDDDTERSNPIISEFAKKVIEILDSYTEFSVSGTGIHVIVKGSLPQSVCGTGRKNSKLGLEVYQHGRYFTMSGNRENSNEIFDRTDELIELMETYFDDSDLQGRIVNLAEYENDNVKLSNDQLWEKMFRSKSGDDIRSLYNGHLINEDHSSSDIALCNHLAFWTGKSATRMDAMFRETSLMREKWDRITYGDTGETYGERTISKAIASTDSTILDHEVSDINEFKLNFNKPVGEELLQKILKQRRTEKIEFLHEQWELNEKRGKEPTSLTPKMCSDILQEHIKFILFDLEENTRLSMYMSNEGIYTSNYQYIKRVISWLEPTLNDSKANDVIYHLINDAEVKPRTESRFLIPVKNGVFNLKTKQLEPFTSDYVFTSKINTNYNPSSTVKVIDGWDIDSWIGSLACGDKQISYLLWQVINDSLNGNYTRKKSIFLLGDGNNGKGTFQELLINLIGQNNAASLRVDEFDERFKLAMLEGKTVVIGDDVQAGVNIDDSANFNSVVTGDRVLVEQKNKPVYSSAFRCTVIQSTNGMPSFKNKTSGTIRRLIIVPFKADFNGEKENFDIKDVYIKDPEVLEYVLFKAINMDFEKFDVPEASERELEEFKIDNDPILDFKKSVFDEMEFEVIPKRFVYTLYIDFCKENGHKIETNRIFLKQFKKYVDKEWYDHTKRFNEKELKELSNIRFIPYIEEWQKGTLASLRKRKFLRVI